MTENHHVNNQITIKQFKRIHESVTLDVIDRVNYLVGANGCGKTSILSGIVALSDPYFCKAFMAEDGLIEYVVGDQKLQTGLVNDGDPFLHGDLSVMTFLLRRNSHFDEVGRNVMQIGFNYSLTELGETEAQNAFTRISDTVEFLGASPIDVHRPGGPFSSTITYVQGGKTIDLRRLADGVKTTIELNNFLQVVQNELRTERADSFDKIHIVLEEPENNLHPSYQKKIPHIFASFFDNIPDYQRDKVHLFVSTHSPFVIGEASNLPFQKTYIIDDGKLVQYDYRSHMTRHSADSDGYRGPNCAWIVSKMLGAELTDIGYPENYCIVEESSILQILNHSRDQGFLRNIMFVSAGGEAKVPLFHERYKNLVMQDRLIRINPYYYDRYLIVVDSTESFSKIEKEKFERLKTSIGNRYHELTKASLEDYYVNIQPSIFEEYTKELASENDRSKHGIIKYKYALRVSELVRTSEHFTQLFGGELDFLIKK